MESFSSRFIGLWLLVILFIAFITELGCATGLISIDVLDAMASSSANWWRAPLWLHVIHSLLLIFVLSWVAMLLFASGASRRLGILGGAAAVLLSSHLSPVYLAVPFIPLAGTVVALPIVGGLLLRAGGSLDPRWLFRRRIPARRGDRILWGLLGLLMFYCIFNQFGEASRVISRRTDFGTFYEAAAALAKGTDPYTATGGGYFYPPVFAFYFRFLTWLPQAGASLLWFSIKMVLVVWSLAAVDSLLQGQDMPAARRRWFIGGTVFVAARFLIADLQYGNVNTFILWLGLMAIVFDFERRSALAGFVSAAAISTKIVPAIFSIYFLVRGRIRVLLWTAVGLLALNLLPFLVAPSILTKSWISYLDAGVRGKLGSRLAQPDNQSLWGVLNRFLNLPFSQTRLLWIGCSLCLSALAAWAAFRSRREGHVRQAGAASLFFLLGLLVSPGSWVVHYGAILLPMAYLFHEAMARRQAAYLLWILFAAANAAFTLSGLARLTVRLSIEQSWFAAANCLVFCAIALLVLRPSASVTKR